MDHRATISTDPEVLRGTPVFNGTRIPIRSLFDHLEAGDTLEEFLEGFPSVSREQATTVLRESCNRLLELLAA
jgi:uncharacterized protein (DUF433 family)